LLPKLLLLFIVLPLVELTLLLMLGDLTRWWVSLLVVVVTGVIGSLLARRQGWQTYRRIQQELAAGHLPTDSLLDAVLIFVAGALLLTPGLLTDAAGLSLLIPACRRIYKARLASWFKARFKLSGFTSPGNAPKRSQVIDSYVIDGGSTAEDSKTPRQSATKPEQHRGSR
jgi:UPF0716 protein FxsA